MKREQVNVYVPKVCNITVTGPSSCGKSIVVDRIKKMLENEFGSVVISKDWETENNMSKYDILDDWQHKMVADTIWCISEPYYVSEEDAVGG